MIVVFNFIFFFFVFFAPVTAIANDSIQSPNIFQKEVFLKLADKYADPTFAFYSEQEAERYYLRSYMFEFMHLSKKDTCLKQFSTIPESLVKNPIHRDVINTLKNFCGFSNSALFATAEKFEKGIKPFFEDRYIALSIYERIALRLVLSNNERTLEQATRNKIKFLKNSIP